MGTNPFASTRRLLNHRSVYSIVLSEDGRFLYSAGGGIIRIWDSATGRQIRRIVSGQAHDLLLSLAARKLFAAGWYTDDSARADSPEWLRKSKKRNWIEALALTSDGITLFSGCDDERIRIWDAKDGSCRGVISETGRISSLAASSNGATLFSGAQRKYTSENDCSIRVWDVATRRQVGRLEGHKSNIGTLLLNPAGDTLYSGSEDASIRVWDLRSGGERLCLRGHRGIVTSLALTADGQTLYSASRDRTVCAWDTKTGRLLEVLRGFSGTTSALALSPDGETLYCSDEHQIHARAARPQPAGAAKGLAHSSEINALIFSPDGTRLYSASADTTIGVWESETGREIGRFSGHPGPIEALALDPTGNLLLSASNASSAEWHGVSTAAELEDYIAIRLWNTESFEKLGERPNPDLRRLPGGPYSASLASALLTVDGMVGGRASWRWSAQSADRLTLFTAVMGKGDISVTEAFNGAGLRSFATRPTRVTALAPKNEHILFCGYADGALREIDAFTGREVRRLEGHNTWLRALAVDPDEGLLISSSDDLTLKTWDMESGAHLGTFYSDSPIRCFATTPSGDIAAGDGAGRLFVFRLRRGDKPRTVPEPHPHTSPESQPRTAPQRLDQPGASSPPAALEGDPMAFRVSTESLAETQKPDDAGEYKAGPDWFLFQPGSRWIRILCPQCHWHDTWDRGEEKQPVKCPRCSFPDPPANHV